MRVAESQVAHRQAILMPAESTHLDYEGEIAVIIGKSGRRIPQGKILAAHRRLRLLQRRLGARLAAPHAAVDCGQELQPHRRIRPRGWSRAARSRTARNSRSRRALNGQIMQHAHHRADDSPHPAAHQLHSRPSQRLSRATVIVTGTPGREFGARRTPPVWMKPGDTVEIEVSKVGVLVNTIKVE